MARGRPVSYKQILKGDGLSEAIKNELTIYPEDVVEKLNAAGDKATAKLVKLTKASAPVDTGDFKKHIARTEVKVGDGLKRYIWYVKPPLHRITHLLAKGYVNKNGDRVKGHPFLQDAYDQVIPEYEKDIEEALK